MAGAIRVSRLGFGSFIQGTRIAAASTTCLTRTHVACAYGILVRTFRGWYYSSWIYSCLQLQLLPYVQTSYRTMHITGEWLKRFGDYISVYVKHIGNCVLHLGNIIMYVCNSCKLELELGVSLWRGEVHCKQLILLFECRTFSFCITVANGWVFACVFKVRIRLLN